MHYLMLFIMCNQWFMMTSVRTHFVIDMITGVIIAHYMHIWSEKLCYYVDVALLRIGSTSEELAATGAGKKRGRKFYKPCHKCGWGNHYAGDFMSVNEKKWLKHVHNQHQAQLNSVVCPSIDSIAEKQQQYLTQEVLESLSAVTPHECTASVTGHRCLHRCSSCGSAATDTSPNHLKENLNSYTKQKDEEDMVSASTVI